MKSTWCECEIIPRHIIFQIAQCLDERSTMTLRQRFGILHQANERADIIAAYCYRHHLPIIFEIDSFVLLHALNQCFCLLTVAHICDNNLYDIVVSWEEKKNERNEKEWRCFRARRWGEEKFNHHKRHITRHSTNLGEIKLRCLVEWKWVISWITDQLDSSVESRRFAHDYMLFEASASTNNERAAVARAYNGRERER